MSICYADNPTHFSGTFNYNAFRATEKYLEHYANLLLLSFIAKNTKDTNERAQANKEIEIARRKMQYCEKHTNYCATTARRGAEKLKAQYA